MYYCKLLIKFFLTQVKKFNLFVSNLITLLITKRQTVQPAIFVFDFRWVVFKVLIPVICCIPLVALLTALVVAGPEILCWYDTGVEHFVRWIQTYLEKVECFGQITKRLTVSVEQPAPRNFGNHVPIVSLSDPIMFRKDITMKAIVNAEQQSWSRVKDFPVQSMIKLLSTDHWARYNFIPPIT